LGSLLIFTVTVFVSAFLLFLVQPLVGKMILPKLGGTPQVWNTCMVFFTTTLLVGYAYSHTVSTRLKLRHQLLLHGAVLAIPILAMLLLARGTSGIPIYGAVQDWSPPAGSNPMIDTFLLLFIIIGIPFLLVSTSAPLLTKWFGYSGHPAAKDPYFLYSASNVGSLLALWLYPSVVEPFILLQSQSYYWFIGYGVLAACIVYCIFRIYSVAPPDAQLAAEAAAEVPPPVGDDPMPAPAPAPTVEATTAVKAVPAPGPARGIQRKKGLQVPSAKADDKAAPRAPAIDIRYGAEAPMTWGRRLRWILLAAVPVSLSLGVTNYVSTDVSPFPLLWISYLSLYLISFIIVFARWPFSWTGKPLFNFGDSSYTMHDAIIYIAQPLGLLALCFIVLTRNFSPQIAFPITWFGFFASALACHGEFAKDRPNTKYLTEYFLLMSFGGAIGSIFNGIFAPIFFQRGVIEFHIAIVFACLVRPEVIPSGWLDELIMNAFPGLRTWARTQGDEMAKSMNRPAPGTTYMFNYFLDVVLGLFVLGISYFLGKAMWDNESWSMAILQKLLQLVGAGRGWSQSFFQNAWIFGIPMVFCFFFAGRPLRIGLAVTGMFLGNLYFSEDSRELLEARRTYFGVLRVMQGAEGIRDEEEATPGGEFIRKLPMRDGKPFMPRNLFNFTYLMHGTTYHGRNYMYTREDHKAGFIKDASRVATTYYHRYGPVGIVFEQYNWLPGRQNTFYADSRMPVTMIGQIAASMGTNQLPLGTLVETWSEPPFATIGLGTGTMVSYARPYQHMTYYEIDDVIRGFSIPEKSDAIDCEPIDENLKGPYRHGTRFTYLQNAIFRGVNLEVIMGDARLSLEPKREQFNIDNSYQYQADFSSFAKDRFEKDRYYMGVPFKNMDPWFEPKGGGEKKPTRSPYRDGYYKAIVVDAFSSDAIPVHLITKQAIEIYLSKLTQDGVLLVHTSNRHMDLVRPVARIALALKQEAVDKAKKDVEEFDEAELRRIWARLNPPDESEKDKDKEKDKEKYKFDAEKAKELYIKSQEVNCLVGKDSAKDLYLGLFSSEYVMIFRGDGFSKWVEKLNAEKAKLNGRPPPGQSILNSVVNWYDPYIDHTEIRANREVKAPITLRDPIWTDDYSYILGVLR
jgi:hypothetical protein